jgi:hypothetical protein
MPKTITRYICNLCGLEHKTEAAALKCEGKHYLITECTPVYENGGVLPTSIKVSYTGKNEKKSSASYHKNSGGYYY